VARDGKPWAQFEYGVGGEYNVWNATAAAAMAAGCGISREEISAALKTFKSVKRRLEVRAKVNGITIIDDFAHHPTAIAGTLTALRSTYPGARLWAILEPRSNTLRRNVLQNELAKSLSLADEVVVANVFKSEAIPEADPEAWPAGAHSAYGRWHRATDRRRVALWRCSCHPFQWWLRGHLREIAGTSEIARPRQFAGYREQSNVELIEWTNPSHRNAMPPHRKANPSRSEMSAHDSHPADARFLGRTASGCGLDWFSLDAT
jgi:hypothetical protein